MNQDHFPPGGASPHAPSPSDSNSFRSRVSNFITNCFFVVMALVTLLGLLDFLIYKIHGSMPAVDMLMSLFK